LAFPAHEVSRSLPWTAWERLGTPDFSPACSCFKTVSRRREKKGRLRRDALTGLSRGNQRDPAIPLLLSLHCVACFLRVFCALCTNPVFKACQLKSWRSQPTKSRDPYLGPLGNAWERWTLVRHVFSFSGRTLSLPDFSSVISVPSCEPCFSRHKQKRIAPSRKKEALTPRCPFCLSHTKTLDCDRIKETRKKGTTTWD
jgi:hypothetical protein